MKCFGKLLFVVILALGSMAFAAMNGPTGLAVDGAGNLFVSNFNANSVQVYNTSYQLTRTVSSGMNGPWGVAVDAAGNLFVANFNGNNVTRYNSKGTFARAVTGPVNPTYLAVDELDNLWVIDNSLQSMEVYDLFGLSVMSYPTDFMFYGVAERGGYLFLGIDANGQAPVNLETFVTADLLAQKANYQLPTIIPGVPSALAFDSKKVEWVVANDGTVYSSADFNTFKKALQTSYLPSGIAVDAAHKRVYLSHNADNSVDVYSTAGVFVTTIK